MAAAVFRTKFTVPSASAHHRPRPRLDRIWRERQPRLVTVTAGAGWGKTAFLADRARAVRERALWYTLDDLDRDPNVLAAHLAAACGLPVSEAPALEQLAAIVAGMESRTLLILDDVHAIASAAAAREFLERLLRYLSPDCSLVLSGREPIDLAAARLEARGEAVRIEASDLALTLDETRKLLTDRLGASAAAAAARVQELTEGWPTGAEICCQSLAESEPADYDETLARLEAGEGGWFERFSAEVLADLAPRMRSFLLRTSVLPRLDARDCDRLLRTRGSARILSALTERGLFVTAAGENTWRYHNLMRRCLRRQLAAESTPAQLRDLARRAAQLAVDDGEPEAAAHGLLRMGDDAGAIAVLRREARGLLATRRPETLGVVLESLPETEVRRRSELLLLRAGHAQLRGRWDDAEADLKRAARGARPGWVGRAARTRLVRLHLQRGRLDACLRSGRRLLTERPRPAPAERGQILTSLGVAAASLGRMEQGREHLQEALELARRGGDRELEGRCLYLMAANLHFQQGDLDAALAAARRARELYRDLGRRDLLCHAEGVLGFVLAGAGRAGEAREATLGALQRAESIGYRMIVAYTQMVLGTCEQLAGDPMAALGRHRAAAALAHELGEHPLATWAHLGASEAALQYGDEALARAAADRALRLATSLKNPYCRGRALGLLGLLDERTEAGAGRAAWTEAENLLRRVGAALELDRLRWWRASLSPDAETVQAELIAAGRGYLLESTGAASVAAPVAGRGTRVAGTGTPLHLRVLGNVEIDRGDQPLLRGAWPSKRARRLFNLLVLGRSRSLLRERAMETLWPGADPRKSSQSLRQTVFQLRRLLEPADGEPVHVLLEGELLRLDPGPDGSCDLDEFEAALGCSRRARQAGEPEREIECLQQALRLWRGPVLADTPYDPEVEERCAALRQAYLRAVVRLLDLLAARERWDELCRLAQRGLDEDPLQEAFARPLLAGLLALGHHAEARATYARFEARLVRELDLLPSAALKELAERAAGSGRSR